MYRRRDGRWVAAVSLPGGLRKRDYAWTRNEAQSKLRALVRAQDDGLVVAGRDRPLAEYLREWLEGTAKQTVRPKTYINYELMVRRIERYLGRVPLKDLGPAHVQALHGRLFREGLSPQSVQQTHMVLKAALKQAVLWDLILRNPADAVKRPKVLRKEMKTLSRQQLQKLLATSKKDRYHALWVVLGTTGLRLGEALGLAWSHVDLELGRMQVVRSLQRVPGQGFSFVEPKTPRSRRTVYLAPYAIEVLKEHQQLQRQQFELQGSVDQRDALVFSSIHGKPLEGGLVSWGLRRALERAELPRIRIHDLRHTVASLLLEDGVHPKIVQELLGHSTVTLTLDTYSHVTPGMHAVVAAQMQKLLDSERDR